MIKIRIFICPCAYATLKQKVTLRLFSAFTGAHPCSLPETKFKRKCMQTVYQTHLLPFFLCPVFKRLLKWTGNKKDLVSDPIWPLR